MKVLPWRCLNSIKKPNITPEVTWMRQNPSSQYRPQVNLTKWLVSVYSSCIFELDFSINQFVCRFWKQFFFLGHYSTKVGTKPSTSRLWRFVHRNQRRRISRKDSIIHLGANPQLPGCLILQNSFLSWYGSMKINRSSKCVLIFPVEIYIMFLLFHSLTPHLLPLRTNCKFYAL